MINQRFGAAIFWLAMFAGGGASAAEPVYPRSADVSSIDGIMKAYYDVISGPANSARDVARDRSLHHPEARVFYSKRDADGSARIESMTVDQYHQQAAAMFNEGFYETERERSVRQFGSSIQVWSTYESRKSSQGPVIARGINNVMLFFDGKRYWILAETWDSERKNNPLPAPQSSGH